MKLALWAPVIAVTLLLLFVVNPSSRDEIEIVGASSPKERIGQGRFHQQVIGSHEVLWERPVGGAPQGLLFLAHGCSHQATDFWPASTCPECLGLPEEVLIRETALSMNYVVVAITSANRESGCWDVRQDAQQSVDAEGVVRILEHVRREEGLAGRPTFALGASSGGAFVLMLPHVMEIQGVVAQIMALPPQMLQLPSGRAYPPTLFVHMPRDQRTAGMVAQDLAALEAAGSPAAEVRVQPRPVTAALLRRAREIDGATAAAVLAALAQGGLLEGGGRASVEGGLLLRNPRQTDWRALLEHQVPGISAMGGLQADKSPLSELLNVAWAGHEIVSDFTRSALWWLEAGGRANIEQLVREEESEEQRS